VAQGRVDVSYPAACAGGLLSLAVCAALDEATGMQRLRPRRGEGGLKVGVHFATGTSLVACGAAAGPRTVTWHGVRLSICLQAGKSEKACTFRHTYSAWYKAGTALGVATEARGRTNSREGHGIRCSRRPKKLEFCLQGRNARRSACCFEGVKRRPAERGTICHRHELRCAAALASIRPIWGALQG
jgi:hypothetical protein